MKRAMKKMKRPMKVTAASHRGKGGLLRLRGAGVREYLSVSEKRGAMGALPLVKSGGARV